ncbi:hypothetical protein QUC31_003580 [Theobroma cacao]
MLLKSSLEIFTRRCLNIAMDSILTMLSSLQLDLLMVSAQPVMLLRERGKSRRSLAKQLVSFVIVIDGGWDTAPGGPYAWGYYFVEEQNNPPAYCDAGWPCASNKKYNGRGPIQLSHNYNYKQAGDHGAIRRDLINNPELVATDATISFKTAIWFWMTPQGNKPSSHDVILGRWTPSDADRAAGRVPGYGAITNIINGGIECVHGPHPSSGDRIGFYKRYCDILGINYGGNLNCRDQKPF